jgi:UDP-GlcNAc:undecaprenyl-phosphate/decaprenyl-phosphate GlcNAc-1-phosphate transferase
MTFTLLQLLASLLIAFGVVYHLIPLLKRIAYEKDLYDKPDGERKIHTRYISSLGGVAIFLGIFLGFSLSGFADGVTGYAFLSAGLLMLFFTGLKDDIIGLSANKKLAIELVSAGLIIYGCGAWIGNFGGILGVYDIPVAIGVPLTVFTVIVIMNAYNLIDGLDGLAGGIGAFASLFFAAGFYVAGASGLAVLSLATAIALFAFLLHNFNPASIFMGDTGSLVVGFLLAFMAVQYVGLHTVTEFSAYFGQGAVILPAAFLAVPLYDTLTVFIKRILRGDGPFTPGKDHVHHQLLEIGFSQKQATLILYAVTIFISISAISLSQLQVNNNIVLAVILLSSAMLLPTNGIKRSLFKKLDIFDIEFYFARQKEIRELTRSSASTQTDNVRKEQTVEV